MRHKSLESADCPIARSLDDIGEWWSLLIVRDAFFGKRRFGEFQKSTGVAKNILAARLKKLVACGIFRLEPASDGSAYQEYVLTQKGRTLGMVVMSLRVWGMRWLFGDERPPTTVLDRNTGEEIVGIGFQTRIGRLVAPHDLEFVTQPVSVAVRGQRARIEPSKPLRHSSRRRLC
jgi:DNA-binding HxlR family transcriptional regulator